MSLERKLLTRAVMSLDSEYSNELMDEIKELLAQPEQEPVAWMYDLEISTNPDRDKIYYYNELSIISQGQQDAVNIRPLYASPPKREPLSDSDIRTHTPFHYHDAEQKAFAVGVRWAEEQHWSR